MTSSKHNRMLGGLTQRCQPIQTASVQDNASLFAEKSIETVLQCFTILGPSYAFRLDRKSPRFPQFHGIGTTGRKAQFFQLVAALSTLKT
ncbi:MAG: hypothetical protein M2R45_02736 [Verrucomicrobia subdivision 3 bacterium]|nr:hypothetical protein [Limisphaerales bacterium]MCS1414286.1 hypothetical protein [Limisphaerales bacterium]